MFIKSKFKHISYNRVRLEVTVFASGKDLRLIRDRASKDTVTDEQTMCTIVLVTHYKVVKFYEELLLRKISVGVAF